MDRDSRMLIELFGSAQALHNAMGAAERKAARIIWHAPDDKRAVVTRCIMKSIAAFLKQLETCRPAEEPQQPGGGVGPDCPPGYHDDHGFCVPDDDND